MCGDRFGLHWGLGCTGIWTLLGGVWGKGEKWC